MYIQEVAEKLHPYTEEELEERNHDKMNPEWRPIIHDGIDTGYVVSQNGDVCSPRGNILKGNPDHNNFYLHYDIRAGNDIYRTTGHRLVALAFIPNPENKPEVNHKNLNRQDNWYKNLEWATKSENMQHSVKNGFFNEYSVLAKKGEEHPGAYHTEEQVHRVCEMFEKGCRAGEVISATGYDRNFVYGILKMGKWSHITSEYDMIDRTGDPLYTDEQIHECCRYLSEGKSNGWIAERMKVPHFMPVRVRNGKLRPDISSQYTFPQVPQREGTRGIPSDTVHKICKLMEFGVGPTEITKIFPSVQRATIHQIKAGKQYTDISKQYKIPDSTKVKGVRTGRVKPGTSKSGMAERLGVGYDYDKVIAALTKSKVV